MTNIKRLSRSILFSFKIFIIFFIPNGYLYAIEHVSDQFYIVTQDENLRVLNDSFIKVNADHNADIRMTGSATILGLVTLPSTAVNVISGSPVVINNEGHLGVGSLVLEDVDNLTTNVGIGANSLNNLITGTENTAIGYNAGTSLLLGSNNIYLGNNGAGAEDNVMRFGSTITHTGCFIAGIAGKATTDILSSLAVVISSDGKLGTILSSRRYKDDIQDIYTRSNNLTKLRPVAFVYKNDPKKITQYGLIAEEVAQNFPELAVYDEEGNPLSVRYDEIPILILNEYLQQKEQLAELQEQLKSLRNVISLYDDKFITQAKQINELFALLNGA